MGGSVTTLTRHKVWNIFHVKYWTKIFNIFQRHLFRAVAIDKAPILELICITKRRFSMLSKYLNLPFVAQRNIVLRLFHIKAKLCNFISMQTVKCKRGRSVNPNHKKILLTLKIMKSYQFLINIYFPFKVL